MTELHRTRWARTPDARVIRELTDAATAVDAVSALSEQSLLNLTSGGGHHVLAYAADAPVEPASGDRPVGYAQLWDDGAAELVVHPAARRHGHGSALLAQLREERSDLRLWAHGGLPAARAFAQHHGLRASRELYRLSRPLTEADRTDPPLPDGFAIRSFEPGRDEQCWLEVNALAFVHHPEQGRLQLSDLRERMAQPWFRPEDLLVLEDRTGPAPAMAGFHWTKVDPQATSDLDPTRPAGEVYVLGVHPSYQGRGLAGPLTGRGIAHLARQGLPEVTLYVDGDNTPARRTYASAGFVEASVDVMYAVHG